MIHGARGRRGRPVPKHDHARRDDGVGEEGADRHELDEVVQVEQQGDQAAYEACNSEVHGRHLGALAHARQEAEEQAVARHRVHGARQGEQRAEEGRRHAAQCANAAMVVKDY